MGKALFRSFNIRSVISSVVRMALWRYYIDHLCIMLLRNVTVLLILSIKASALWWIFGSSSGIWYFVSSILHHHFILMFCNLSTKQGRLYSDSNKSDTVFVMWIFQALACVIIVGVGLLYGKSLRRSHLLLFLAVCEIDLCCLITLLSPVIFSFLCG